LRDEQFAFASLLPDFDPAAPATITREDIMRALEAMWRGPEPPFSPWRRHRPRRLWHMTRRGRSWIDREIERTAWQRVGSSAWIESVRVKLQSAAYATDQGWSWSWDSPGVYGRPDLPEWMVVRDDGPPAYLPEAQR
jgi:hypothetical protein